MYYTQVNLQFTEGLYRKVRAQTTDIYDSKYLVQCLSIFSFRNVLLA